MIITRKEFQAYLRIQHKGTHNMYSLEATQAVQKIHPMTVDKYKVIQNTYEDLQKAFIGTNVNSLEITVYDQSLQPISVYHLRNLEPDNLVTYTVFGGQADIYIGKIEYLPSDQAIRLLPSRSKRIHLRDLLIFPDQTRILIEGYEGFEPATLLETQENTTNFYFQPHNEE